MPPRKRKRSAKAEQTSAAPSVDASTNRVSSNRKNKGKNTQGKLPRLVIKRPQGGVATAQSPTQGMNKWYLKVTLGLTCICSRLRKMVLIFEGKLSLGHQAGSRITNSPKTCKASSINWYDARTISMKTLTYIPMFNRHWAASP